MNELRQIPRLGACACVWREGKVLLVTRTKPPLIGVWGFPGGHVEWGETMREAAHRELAEETGVSANLDRFVELRDTFRRDAAGQVIIHYAIAVYTGAWISGEAVADTDAGEAGWYEPDALRGLELVPGTAGLVALSAKLLED